MPHIQEIDPSESNKEDTIPNYHPNSSSYHFNLDDIDKYFDNKFKTYAEYRTYVNLHLQEWALDTDFRLFDAAYCLHRLNEKQINQYTEIEKVIETMKETIHTSNQTQLANIRTLLPRLRKKGFAEHLTSLERPPEEQQKKKKRKEPPAECPKCRLPLVYDHVAWCRGLTDGYTCRCPKEMSLVIRTKSSTPPLSRRPTPRCFTCKSPHHLKQQCPDYRCYHCRQYAPGHRVSLCPKRYRPSESVIKEERNSPTMSEIYGGEGYTDVYGYEDGNLTGEC